MRFDFTTVLSGLDLAEIKPAGSSIFEMGALGEVLYIVKSGQAEIRVGDLVLETAGEGDLLGEMAILDEQVHQRSASAIALTDCEVVAMNRQRFLELLRANPEVGLEVSKLMVRRLRSTTFLSHHDRLTQLPNRALLSESCDTAVKRAMRRGTTVGVLIADVDNFGKINESLGYQAGDELLLELSKHLRGQLHELDVLARLGANQFAVILEDQTSSQIAAAAEHLRTSLVRPFSAANHDIYVSLSIGISCYPQDGATAAKLIANASAALYAAKEQGRNRCSYFSPELHTLAVETFTLQNYLRSALERNEFFMNYQPRADLSSGRITAVEALLRWRHPELGLVPPGKFIPIAEQAGMIDEIGEWVLRTSCAQQKTWLASGISPFRMAVNLSARQLRHIDLKDRVAAILAETGLDADSLELEITESAVMEDPARTVFLLKELRSLGIGIALDDFGTQYSSLGYLKQFPLDYMKIDQCFVRGIPTSNDDSAITKTIITLAKNLRLRVIAEGVETQEQMAFLVEHGCEEVQGYLFSRPLAGDAAEAMLIANLGKPA
ncbi:MAG: EAL domain-containing protein [Betaproteobacteria bacterium]|nr:EAL domain-containing protein [Betaproteobacteria bacterium]